MISWLKRVTFKNKILYLIPEETIVQTETVLKAYANGKYSKEGLVYWAGEKKGKVITVKLVVAPYIISDKGYFSVSHVSNARYIELLSNEGYLHIAQLHTHPGEWVDHSIPDDECASFKIEGLISIVVPFYSLNGMLPLKKCGIHIFHKNRFCRISNKNISSYFKVKKGNSKFIDHSNESG